MQVIRLCDVERKTVRQEGCFWKTGLRRKATNVGCTLPAKYRLRSKCFGNEYLWEMETRNRGEVRNIILMGNELVEATLLGRNKIVTNGGVLQERASENFASETFVEDISRS